ncbi:MAG: M61 family metallopeptidase, partial [Planctomycetaceae bacterium]|nr:M61 family metallopeptidase [Planctomycetaceae bacterium]
FILHAVPGAGGGLEHLNSQVSASRDLRFTDREKYEDYLSLISHEYFHLWNVKRLRPAMLGPFDYARETYTESLWICEGLTVYYEWLLLLRGGVIKRDRLLKAWASDIERWQGRPGNAVMGLRESSFLAWTKLYLMDENFANSGISYYLKGGLVGMLLDLEIRKRTRGRRSLDDVMRLGVERHGYPKPGFERRGFEAMVEEIAPGDWKAWFEHHLDSTTPLDLEGALAAVGLELVHDVDDKADVDSGKKEKRTKKPWLGWQLKDEKSALTISSVETGSPASTGGVSAKDELLAVNGMRVKSNSDVEQLLDYHGKGTKLALTVFRNDRLHQCSVTIGEKPAGSLVLRVMKKANVAQFKRLEDWLGKA